MKKQRESDKESNSVDGKEKTVKRANEEQGEWS